MTEEEQEHAIRIFQDTLRDMNKISVAFDSLGCRNVVKKYWLSCNSDLVDDLNEQVALADKMNIPPMSVFTSISPNIKFTLHPAEVNIVFFAMDAKNPPPQLLFVTWKNGQERWDCGLGQDFVTALLDSRLQNGKTVWEQFRDDRAMALNDAEREQWLRMTE